MSSLVAQHALSDDLVLVGAEGRPDRREVASGRPIVYAVFEETAEEKAVSGVLGLVDVRRAMRFPQRIFADLLHPSPPAVVTPDVPLADVERRLQETPAAAVLVANEAGSLVGAVTRESASTALLHHERSTARRLKNVLERQESQRRLFAFEIHDGVAQYASAARMHLEAFAAMQGRMERKAKSEFKRAVAMLQETLRETRSLLQGLHWQHEGDLVQAVRSLIEARQAAAGPAIELSVSPATIVISEAHHLAVYRTVQEALSNALKHSGSERIRVTLSADGQSVESLVQDWGRGFDPQTAARGHGLTGIRRRAALLGGTIRIDSAPGEGTCVRANFPFLPDGREP